MTDNNQPAPTARSNPNLIPAIIIASGLALGGYFLGARQEMVVVGDGGYAYVMISDRFGGLKACNYLNDCSLWVKGLGFVDEVPDVAADAADAAAAAAAKAAPTPAQ
jgi:hypothetical protein